MCMYYVSDEVEGEKDWRKEYVFSQISLLYMIIKIHLEDEDYLLKLKDGCRKGKVSGRVFYVRSGVLRRKWRPPDRSK